MLRYIQEEGLPYSVTLIFSNRDRESTAFLAELQELERENPNFRLVLTMTQDPGWDGEKRRIDSRFFEDYLNRELSDYTFLVAGPPAMVEGVQKTLEDAGVEEENVIAARFSGY
jgi:ferredoxin-NADP reductase